MVESTKVYLEITHFFFKQKKCWKLVSNYMLTPAFTNTDKANYWFISNDHSETRSNRQQSHGQRRHLCSLAEAESWAEFNISAITVLPQMMRRHAEKPPTVNYRENLNIQSKGHGVTAINSSLTHHFAPAFNCHSGKNPSEYEYKRQRNQFLHQHSAQWTRMQCSDKRCALRKRGRNSLFFLDWKNSFSCTYFAISIAIATALSPPTCLTHSANATRSCLHCKGCQKAF